MSRYRFAVFLFLLFIQPAISQVGCMGKRFIIKTDIVNGIKRPISSIGLEAAYSRNVSVEINYTFSETIAQAEYHSKCFASWVRSASDQTWNSFLPGYTRTNEFKSKIYDLISNDYSLSGIKSRQKLWGGIVKIYSNSILSAPYGKYYQFGFRTGKQLLSGQFNVPYYIYSPYYSSFIKNGERVLNFKSVEVNFFSLTFGRGRQFLLHPRIMLDINCGMNANFTYTSNFSQNSIFCSIVGERNGSTLLSFLRGTGTTYEYSRKSVHSNASLFLNMKLGFLLF